MATILGGIASAMAICESTSKKLDERAQAYAQWILVNVCDNDEDAIVGMDVQINPRVDSLGCIGDLTGLGDIGFHTKCKSFNWDKGYITVEGGDYELPAELYAQRIHKIGGVTIPQL